MIRSCLAVLAVNALLTTGAFADSWHDDQVEWARHNFHHGAWDCNGNCSPGHARQARAVARSAPRGHSFDGTWAISAAGPCSGVGTSQVVISGNRILSPNGGGHVSPNGTVNTVSNVDGVTIIGEGQIFGRSASGIYRQSDGCTGSWDAVKL